jgi:energy-coupling factor transporter ATP-binding protein EcfA2
MNNSTDDKIIIIIAGKKGSGKDLVAKIMEGLLTEQYFRVNITHFADLLKEMSRDLLSNYDNTITNENFNDKKDDYNKFLGDTNRSFLQNLGTVVRNYLGDDVWANAVNIKENHINIIADARYKNEIDCIKYKYPDHKVITIRLYRNVADTIKSTHHSEDIDFLCDISLPNNDTKDELYKNIKFILNHNIL